MYVARSRRAVMPPGVPRDGSSLVSTLGQAPPKRRILIFYGYYGVDGNDGRSERDLSFQATARTLQVHLARRFPTDSIEIICAWHKDIFIKALSTAPPDPAMKIRQLHYCGHGAPGGLYFGYRNAIAAASRNSLNWLLFDAKSPFAKHSTMFKRASALRQDSGLMSGFFSSSLTKAQVQQIKGNLAPDALMHIWGCFAGSPCHTFDISSPYWNLFNTAGGTCAGTLGSRGGAVVGIARHLAQSLGISVTAIFDPTNVGGMNFCTRTNKGAVSCSNDRQAQVPHWMWPRARSVRWVTYDRTGAGDTVRINFIGTIRPQKELKPGQPPTWFTHEFPVGRGPRPITALPAC